MKAKAFRIIYLFLGLVSLVLAYFGIIMPGVPGIPFVLLALFFFANSSEKLHAWMLRQKLIAKMVERKNTPKGKKYYKLIVISQLWVSLTVACLLFVRDAVTGIVLFAAGVIFSFVTNALMDK